MYIALIFNWVILRLYLNVIQLYFVFLLTVTTLLPRVFERVIEHVNIVHFVDFDESVTY